MVCFDGILKTSFLLVKPEEIPGCSFHCLNLEPVSQLTSIIFIDLDYLPKLMSVVTRLFLPTSSTFTCFLLGNERTSFVDVSYYLKCDYQHVGFQQPHRN